MIVPCPKCKIEREIDRDRGAMCRPCYNETRKGRKQYGTTCIDCGKYSPTNSDTKALRCKSCAVGHMRRGHKTPEDQLVRYERTCTGCGETSMLMADPKNRKTTLCGFCSRSATGKKNKGGSVAKPKPPVEAKKVIAAKPKVHITVTKSRRKYDTSSRLLKKSKTNEVSQLAIDRAREINREHREAVANAQPIPQTKTDEEMMEEFLKNNKPSVEIKDEPMPHVVCGGFLYLNTSVGGKFNA